MGNAYDYMNPEIIICDRSDCHKASREELERIIEQFVKSFKSQ